MKAKYNPEINLGNLVQIGTLIILAIGAIITMKVHEAHQDNKIQNNTIKLEEQDRVNVRQDTEIKMIDSQVSRIDERTKNNVRNN